MYLSITPLPYPYKFPSLLRYLVAAKGHPLNFCCFVLDTFKTKFVKVGLLEKCLDVLKPVYRRAYVNWIFLKKEKKTDQTRIVFPTFLYFCNSHSMYLH